MDKNELKIYLRENPEYIKEILESLNCHNVKITKNKRVQAARPNGDNQTSIHIKLNDFLNTTIYTKKDFQDNDIKDFFALVEYLKECDFNEAMYYVCNICNIEYSRKTAKKNKSNSYEFLKKYKRSLNKSKCIEEINETILPENYTERFVKASHVIYLNDGVSEKTQEKFGISYDILDDRIVTPIRNDEGKLITFKGRTCNKNYKIYGIPKFIYYYPFYAENYLFGLYENYFHILCSDEVYVGEAEKFTMQCDTFGVNNALAVSKKTISEIQVKKLLKLGKPIVIMFDKDVTLEEIFIECRKFKGLIDVYYVYDTLSILTKKESPTDKGREIFDRLLNECKFKYKGE